LESNQLIILNVNTDFIYTPELFNIPLIDQDFYDYNVPFSTNGILVSALIDSKLMFHLIHPLEDKISEYRTPETRTLKIEDYSKEKDISKMIKNVILFEPQSNLYLYEYKDTLDNSEIRKNPTKDTIEYMFTMAYKTEFVRKAIHMNNYGAKQFIWMDIGIKHMINVSDEEFCEKVMRLRNISYNLHVRIPSIWNPDITYTCGEIYKEVLWYFAGSMFGGNINSLLEFADLTKETSLNIIKTFKNKFENRWLIHILIKRRQKSLEDLVISEMLM
jgi:hypothetical protein